MKLTECLYATVRTSARSDTASCIAPDSTSARVARTRIGESCRLLCVLESVVRELIICKQAEEIETEVP